MNKEQYMQQLIDQGYDKLTILRMVSEKFPEEEPKKQTDPVRQETSMGSNNMVSSSAGSSLELQSSSMGPFASLEEQFGFEAPKDIERMQEVEITAPKRAPEELTFIEEQFGKNGFTDFVGDIYRSWESGKEQGESLDAQLELFKGNTTAEEINAWLDADERLSKARPTDEMLDFQEKFEQYKKEDGSVLGFVNAWLDNPSAMLQSAVQSTAMALGAVINSEEAAAAAGAGAVSGGAVGSFIPIVGTASGAFAGGFGAVSTTMEVGFTMSELLKEKIIEDLREDGVDKSWEQLSKEEKKDLVLNTLNDENKKQTLKSRALKRGVTIGLFDTISGGITSVAGKGAVNLASRATRTAFKASNNVSKVGLRTAAKALPTAGRATTETLLGMAGEAAGQKAAGQDISMFDILQEGFADKTFTVVGLGKDVAVGAIGKGNYKINGEKLSFNKFSKEIQSMDDVAFSELTIEANGDDVVEAIIKNRKQDINIDQNIDSKISDVNDRAELISIERQINELKSSDSETNKNRVAKLKERVKEISDAYADAEVDVNIEERQQAVANASRNRVEREFNGFAKRVEQAAQDVDDVEILKFETKKEVDQYLESRKADNVTKRASMANGFILQEESGKQTIVLNKEVATQDNAVTVASHELLHSILYATIRKDANNSIRLGNALLKKLNSIDREKISNSEFKSRMERYADESKDVQMEEALTLFSDALALGEIKYNENAFTRLGDVVRRTLQRNNKINIKFNTGKDVYNFIRDYNKSIEEGKLSGSQIALAKEGAKGRLVSEQKEAEGSTVKESKAKATVLEEINNLLPETIKTKDQFLSDRSFTKVYESAMNPGGAINNYIKSRTSSAMEAELAVDSVLERLMNFDPEAKRKDGSTIGRQGFGEFIFANTAFGKLDAKKKLFQESERKSKETSIDESTKQIADVETVAEEQVETKQKPKINPLKFTGVPSGIKLSDKPGKGLTFKKVSKQYAGEVGEQAIGIPAKKITESAANLGSVNEARSIQQFFFKADNLDKFIKILPETNIALPETEIGIETLDVSRQVQGTGLGLPKRILDYFYEDFIDPTGKLTSPKGRSKGLTSQTAVKRLKPEFRGTVSKETIDKVKKDIGITPKGELNILPKGELRSPIGQLLKGMAKTYSTLAANTLVRQEMEAAGATKQEVADVAAGKTRVMLSDAGKKPKPEQLLVDSKGKKALEDQDRVTMGDNFKPTKKELVAYAEEKTKDVNKSTGLPVKVVEKGIQFLSTGNKAYLDNKRPYLAINNRENKNRDGTVNEEQTAINKKAEKDGLVFVAKDALEISKTKPEINYLTRKPFTEQEATDLKAAFREKHDGNIDRNIKELESINRGKELAYRLFSDAIKRDASNSQYISEILYNGGLNKNIGRSMAPTLGKQADIIKGGKTDEHTLQNVVHARLAKTFMTIGGKSLDGWIKWANENYYQIAVKKRRSGTKDLPQTDEFLNMKYPIDGKIYSSKDELHPEIAKVVEEIVKGTKDFSDLPDSSVRMFDPRLQEKVTKEFDTIVINANTTTFKDGTFASHYNVEIPSKYNENLDILIEQNKIIYEVAAKKIDKATARNRMDKVLKVKEDSAKTLKSNTAKSPSIVKFSKSNKQLLNNLNNYDKALRNARNPKAPIKGISVFDFDDTLATTKSMVGVTMPDGTKTKIDATEFAKRGDDLLEQGAEFDFSDFSKVVDGKPGPLITKLEKALKKFGNKDIFVLTARPANSASAIYEFLKGLGFEIPLENITGLANSSPEAKAQWMVDKAAEGYNDFYFTDDAYKNVKAVQDAMSVLDVKSKERIVYKDIYDKMDREFNDILEAKSGIASEKTYSKAKAEVVGSSQGKFKWFIPPSADDFVGLLYNTLAKGKLGDAQMAWYKKNLLDPYARAMNAISSERVSLAADYKALKKRLGIVPKNLRKQIKGEGFTKEQAIRMYIWNKQGMDIPGLSKSDLKDMVEYVESDASLQVFADQLIEINKGDGYPEPKDYWLAGSITTDLMDGLGGTKRAKHLEQWQQNVDAIFSEKNLNKLEAIHGKAYREALENMLQRMKSGKNRNYPGDSTTGRMMDWLNGSIGAIMFLNTRSAVLQTLSAVNFINFKDNNILAAGKAFANQKQYWKDFKELFNSDFLKERREGMNINVNEADIAEMANKGGAKGAISHLLQLGFTPTQIADSFAIASGGATFYRNRIKSYIKQGMSEAEAKEKAFLDFRETAEESQQSSRPDRISKQQAGPLGRVVLAFANTPSQYARIIKKASQDLMAGRGDTKTNISKIIYYGAVQGFIFNAIQQALFAADLDDEDEKTEKMIRLGNGMADGVLRGMGVSGAAVTVVKNAGLRVYNESQKDRPKYEKVAFELTKLSPPIASKLSRINQAAREVQWNSDEMKQKGFSLDNPAWLAAGNVISATTNVPVDRVIKKVNNVNDALSQDVEMQERIALLAGWQSWELGIDKKEKETNKEINDKLKSVGLRKVNIKKSSSLRKTNILKDK